MVALDKNIDRPALRYYGGKFRIAPWIVSFFPKHTTYVEPFGGAASVLLRKMPSQTDIYNDLNSEIVNLFKVLRDPEQAAQLQRLLELTPYSREEWKSCYAICNDPIEQARRTIVLGFMGFNASKAVVRKPNGFRTCSSGHHKLPDNFIRYGEFIPVLTRKLRGVIIENTDANKLMLTHDRKTTLHYVDPPYLMETRSYAFNGYAVETSTLNQHEELIDTLINLKGFVVMSCYDHEMYQKLLDAGFSKYQKTTVNGSKKSSKAIETVFVNGKVERALNAPTLF